jgi:drug/metabolite transporter (DMT)-like permease
MSRVDEAGNVMAGRSEMEHFEGSDVVLAPRAAFLATPAGVTFAVVVCSLIWGTTWYAITLQLGVVPPTASVVYRFSLAAAVLAGWCLASGQSLRLTRAQHVPVFGQGVLTFSIQYSLVYAAEEHVPSAVVAVIFAGLAFVNLVLFRVLLGHRAHWQVWLGAALGILGVAALFLGELTRAEFDPRTTAGLFTALVAMVIAAGGNLAAWRAQKEGAGVLPSTAWAMGYGALIVAAFGWATGVEWRFELTASYVLSLAYLAVFGSVVAFGLFFSLARARGYARASYISAVTPPVAMLVSVVMEDARFGLAAFAGLGLVLAGQVLMIRARRE